MLEKVGITHYQGHVSPVFDVARHLLAVSIRDGLEQGREEFVLDSTDPFLRAQELKNIGLDAVVCGAISQPYERALSAKSITAVAFVCGALDDVILALLKGQLEEGQFLMPGSSGPRRHRGRRGRRE